MKKQTIALLFVIVLVSVSVFPVSADPLEKVEGYWIYTPLGCEKQGWAGPNYILRNCADEGIFFDGAFEGTTTEVYDFVMQGAIDPTAPLPTYEKGFYKGLVTFTGTVKGVSGTMEIMFLGKSPGDIFTWSGTWRIISGTGGLANIHGNGTWESPTAYGLYYQGHIHFAP